MKRAKAALLLVLILCSTAVSTVYFSPSASGLTDADASVEEKLFAYTYMRGMQSCFKHSKLGGGAFDGYITPELANNGKWFTTDNPIEKDSYPLATGEKKSCADVDFVKTYLRIFGYTSGVDALGDGGLRMNRDGNGNFDENGENVAARVPATVAAKWGKTPYLDRALSYVLQKKVLESDKGCQATVTTDRTLANGPKGAITKTVSDSGEIVETFYLWGPDNDDGTEHTLANTGTYDEWKQTCQQMADDMSGNAPYYVSTFPVQSCDVKYAGNDAQISACEDGEQHPDDVDYCKTTYHNAAAEPGTEQACLYGQKHASFDPGGTTEDPDKVISCQIEAIGWIVCPVVRFLAKTTDAMYGMIRSMLLVQPAIIDQSNSNSAYTPWTRVRDLANVAFIVVFIIIVYSHLTSAGISNYNIKKMLPKLIVGALLVNLSFWISGLLVELSNLVGTNIFKLIGGAADTMYPATITEEVDAYAGLGGWDKLALIAIGVGGAAIAASGIVTVAIFLPLVVSAGLAILTVLIVLTVRQALIVMMVIISPLAFVAYLLPNTEGLFKKWWGLFKSLLLLFPIISFIFASSALASVILTNVSNTSEGEAPGDLASFAMSVMAAAVSIIPLFITPILMKVTTGALGQITGMVNNKNRGLIDRSKNYARDKQKDAWMNSMATGPRRFGAGGKWNPLNHITGTGRRLYHGRLSRQQSTKNAETNLESQWAGSARGQQLLGQQQNAQTQLKTAQNQAYINRLNSGDPEVEEIELKAKVAELDLSEAEEQSKLRVHATPVFEQAAIRDKIAADELKAVEARTDALHDELKTTSGAAVATAHGLDAAIADRAKSAAEATYKYGQRAGMAGMKLKTDMSDMIGDDIDNPTQAAIDAAGVMGNAGVSLVQAQARQTKLAAANEAIAAEKTTMRELNHEQLMGIVQDETASDVRRTAAAGMIASKSYRDGHLELLEYLSQTAHVTGRDDSGKVTSLKSAVTDMQQQFMADASGMPGVLGDTEKTALGEGKLAIDIEKLNNDAGRTGDQRLTIKEHLLRERLAAGKVSEDSFATLDPDDVKVLDSLYEKGALDGKARENVEKVIRRLRQNRQAYQPTKEAQRAIHEKILPPT